MTHEADAVAREVWRTCCEPLPQERCWQLAGATKNSRTMNTLASHAFLPAELGSFRRPRADGGSLVETRVGGQKRACSVIEGAQMTRERRAGDQSSDCMPASD